MRKNVRKLIINRRSWYLWLIGFAAFLWVILRSGTNPKRLTYPCQQAAYPLASAWFIAIASLLSCSIILRKVFRISIPAIAIFIVTWFFISNSPRAVPNTMVGSYPVWTASNTVSKVFVYDNIPLSTGTLNKGNSSVPDSYLSDPGIDSLIKIMEAGNTPFFKTSSTKEGIVGNDDVVILKCNFQWRHKLGTNTDRIKGVIWNILNHPEGFVGEILVCDNAEAQIWPDDYLAGFTDYSNNSDDPDQSIVDVVHTFKAKGYPVDYYVWDSLNYYTVNEYSEGDMSDGYIFNPTTLTSYPKFLSPGGSFISLKNGIYNSSTNAYDPDNLTIINFPVLKSHWMAGASIALKNYIGVMNTTKHDEWFGGWVDDTFHPLYCFSEYALVARELDICWPKLNIVDATWVATHSNWDYNSQVVNTRTVLASTDPVAISWYAAKHILLPIAGSPYDVDPDLNGKYGKNLNYWYDYLDQNTSRVVTKSPDNITVFGKGILNGAEDIVPPSVPLGLDAVYVTADSIMIQWLASTDNVGVSHYNVYRNGMHVGTTDMISYSDYAVDACNEYIYKISAVDEAGNSSSLSAGLKLSNCPPDLAPTLIITPNVSHGVSKSTVFVRISELNLTGTVGTIVVNIPADPRWHIKDGYDPNLSILEGMPLNNNVWAYSFDTLNHTFTTNATIAAGGFSTFGFVITFNPDSNMGSYTITARLLSGSGGEVRDSNNTDSERLDYFQ